MGLEAEISTEMNCSIRACHAIVATIVVNAISGSVRRLSMHVSLRDGGTPAPNA